MTPADRLRAAIHMESAAIAPQTSPLIEAAKEVLAENGRFRSALEWIERQQFADRDTVTPEAAWDAFGKMNRAVCAIYAKATDALHQQQITLSEPTPEQEAYLRKIEEASSRHDPSTIIGGRE